MVEGQLSKKETKMISMKILHKTQQTIKSFQIRHFEWKENLFKKNSEKMTKKTQKK